MSRSSRPRLRRVALVAALVSAGCHLGAGVKQFAPAHGPQGVSVEVLAGSGRIAGELLELRDSGLLLLAAKGNGAGTRVVLAPFNSDQAPVGAPRERLRQVSRFPQGLSEELLHRLLEQSGQAEVELIQ